MGSITFKGKTSKGPVALVDTTSSSYQSGVAPVVIGSDGNTYQGVKYNVVDEGGGAIVQYRFPGLPTGMKATLQYGNDTQSIDTGGYFTGQQVGKLTASSSGGGGGQDLGGAQRVGAYGVAPKDISSEFPTAQTAFVDPTQFAKTFGDFNTENLKSNNTLAKSMALDNLDTELQGLKAYAPAATALKQSITASDNTVNQAMRTAQVNQAVPDVVKDLNSVAADARTYASGRAPDSVTDRGLELSNRAAAADTAASSGFGASSSAARSVSDLMDAKSRISLSQYGESLLSSNATQRSDLLLAPTEYSNAGTQLSAAPSVSGSQLQEQNLATVNNATLLSPETAYNSTVQQAQYNTTNTNDFALSLFNYKVGLSNAVASAGQTSINTGISLQQQQEAQDTASSEAAKTRHNNTVTTAIKVGGQVVGAISSALNFGSALSDKRLKEDIQEYNSGLNEICKLTVFKYRYKKDMIADDGGIPHIGVMAQELKEILPEAVIEGEQGFLQIDPSQLLFTLINAVKELNEKYLGLEKEVNRVTTINLFDQPLL